MSPRIPDPEYVTDSVSGAIYQTPEGGLLMIGEAAPTAGDPIARGPFAIRYAIPLIMPPTMAVIPGLLFGERGGALVGREGWDYLQTHFQLHPRADVIGLLPDGSRAQYLVKELDFGVPVRVFAYTSAEDMIPLIELTAFRAVEAERDALPELLERYLPRLT